jgi:hypothetical protein
MSTNTGELEVEMTCPLGHTCQKIVDGKIERCMAFAQFEGTDGQGNEVNEWGCTVFKFNTRLMIEQIGQYKGTTSAIESFRNEMVMGNQQFAQLFANAAQNRLK